MSNLVSVAELLEVHADPNVRILDVRFDLTRQGAGPAAYAAGHVPGAVYLDLDHDLSLPPDPSGLGGRHPLPAPEVFASTIGAMGVAPHHHVIAYDDAGGAYAARAWWMLRWIGYRDVRVLDGGFPAWCAAGGTVTREVRAWPAVEVVPVVDDGMLATAEQVRDRLADPRVVIVDARAPERYRGDVEPLDPVAGHVPGAINLPFQGNLRDGHFASREVLGDRFAGLEAADEVIVYCGSGVTAAHDALAIEEAGLPLPRLYAGSWSDWCRRPFGAVETAARPRTSTSDETG